MLRENDVPQQMYCWVLTGIRDDETPHCNLGYNDTFDLLIILNHSSWNISLSASLKRVRIFEKKNKEN